MAFKNVQEFTSAMIAKGLVGKVSKIVLPTMKTMAILERYVGEYIEKKMNLMTLETAILEDDNFKKMLPSSKKSKTLTKKDINDKYLSKWLDYLMKEHSNLKDDMILGGACGLILCYIYKNKLKVKDLPHTITKINKVRDGGNSFLASLVTNAAPGA